MNIKFKRRRTIEIYFILYLAALVYLIPDSSKNEPATGTGTGIQVITPKFALFTEKTNLICRLIMDSTGPKILYLDSSNTIYYSGDVEDVRFEYIIEDQSLRQSLTISSDVKPYTKYFRTEPVRDKQASIFYWNPPLTDRQNKTYLVRVNAYGTIRTTRGKTGLSDETGTLSQIYKVTQQFSLLMIYVNEPKQETQIASTIFNPYYILQDSAFRLFPPYPDEYSQIPKLKMTIRPEKFDIPGLAYQQWTNIVWLSNVNAIKHLSEEPKLTIVNEPYDNKGEASILDVQDEKIIIHGKIPSTGKMTVKLLLKRKDGDEQSSVFVVKPTPFEQAEYPKVMYPGQDYRINPNIPLLGTSIRAYLKDGDVIRASSQGERFQFTPEITDTGKTLVLERYIDNNLLGERNYLRVLNYPDPLIHNLYPRGKEVEVITYAYGYHNNSRNEIVDFYVEGNAKWTDLRGRMSTSQEQGFSTTIQHFKFYPNDPDKQLEFRIIAIDKRGKRSFPRRHP